MNFLAQLIKVVYSPAYTEDREGHIDRAESGTSLFTPQCYVLARTSPSYGANDVTSTGIMPRKRQQGRAMTARRSRETTLTRTLVVNSSVNSLLADFPEISNTWASLCLRWRYSASFNSIQCKQISHFLRQSRITNIKVINLDLSAEAMPQGKINDTSACDLQSRPPDDPGGFHLPLPLHGCLWVPLRKSISYGMREPA
ncbi:unnamed protein product [Leptidea sinapis]|uniref:Uncharacterized protein n=1 Tax=Leptidea sinapis TaxID=189913 RepID=A0A5E4QAE8_9NEOP|nr:unnamed protein product [Leptidea sinapis]